MSERILDAVALRRAFDDAFARPAEVAGARTVDLLGVTVGEQPFAVLVADVTAVHQPKKIAPAPSRQPALLGLAGVRGNLVAVYDLGRLLGHGATRAARPWIAVARASETMAFAFDEVSGLLRVPVDALVAAPAGGARFVSRIARAADTSRSVLEVAAVVAALSPRSASADLSTKE